MTLYNREVGELGEEADLLVNRMFNMLVRELRENYGTSVPADDRLYDVEIVVRNYIWRYCPKARAESLPEAAKISADSGYHERSY
jgi:hypothetical protein